MFFFWFFLGGFFWGFLVLLVQMVWTDGIVGGLFTYILFWTLVYAVVHIY